MLGLKKKLLYTTFLVQLFFRSIFLFCVVEHDEYDLKSNIIRRSVRRPKKQPHVSVSGGQKQPQQQQQQSSQQQSTQQSSGQALRQKVNEPLAPISSQRMDPPTQSTGGNVGNNTNQPTVRFAEPVAQQPTSQPAQQQQLQPTQTQPQQQQQQQPMGQQSIWATKACVGE